MNNKWTLNFKLSHSYVFCLSRVIVRELEISSLRSYTNISNVAVGKAIKI